MRRVSILDDIVESVSRIKRYTAGFDAKKLSDDRTLDAVIRHLEIIADIVANKLPALHAALKHSA